MADNSYWTIIPPSVTQNQPSVNFPAIDKVRGPGGAAKMLEAEQKLGAGHGFLAETIGPIADEVNAGASAAVDYLRGRLTGNRAGFGELYGDYKKIASSEQDAYRKDHPIASTAANIVGAVGRAPVAGMNALANLTLGQSVLQGAKTGAKVGAAVGFAEGDGLTNRLETAATGAGVGAIFGMGIPVIANVTQRVAGAAKNLMGLKGDQAVRQAQIMVAEALKRDGITAADLMARRTAGKPITAADLGPNMRAVVGAASRQGGEGKAILEQFLEDRTQGQFKRISQDIAGGTGMKGEDFAPTAGVITERRAAAAGPGYREAYKAPAPQLSENGIGILSTPDGKRAVATAARMMQNKRRPIADEAGNYTVEMLDQIQRAMRDSANRQSGARAGEMAGNINSLRGQFLDELPPELRKVMADYRSESELLDAMEAGRKFLRGDAETLAAAISDMSPQQADMFRLGVARELRAKMGAKIDSGDISGMFQNPQIRERLSAIFPSKRLFQDFLEKVKTERIMQETRNAILKGSQTAERKVADQEFGAGALGEFASDVATGGGVGVGVTKAVTNAAMRGKDRLLQGVNENVAREVAGLAVNPNLSAVAQAISGPQGRALQSYPVSPAAQIAGNAAGIPAASAAGAAMSAPAQSYWTIIPPQN